MVPVGKIRICVDLKKLNEAIKMENFMLAYSNDGLLKLVGAKYFLNLMLPVDSINYHYVKTVETYHIYNPVGKVLLEENSDWDNVSTGVFT